MHEVLVNRLGGLSLPRKSVVRLTDRPDMTLDVYRGRKTTMQQQKSQLQLNLNGIQKWSTENGFKFSRSKTVCMHFCHLRKAHGGGAMVLGKLSVPGRPTIWITVGQGPTALAVGAGGVVWTFLLSSILSFLFLPLFGRRPDID